MQHELSKMGEELSIAKRLVHVLYEQIARYRSVWKADVFVTDLCLMAFIVVTE